MEEIKASTRKLNENTNNITISLSDLPDKKYKVRAEDKTRITVYHVNSKEEISDIIDEYL